METLATIKESTIYLMSGDGEEVQGPFTKRTPPIKIPSGYIGLVDNKGKFGWFHSSIPAFATEVEAADALAYHLEQRAQVYLDRATMLRIKARIRHNVAKEISKS